MGLYHSDAMGKYEKALKLLNEAYNKSIKPTKRSRSVVKPQQIYQDIFRVRKLLHDSTTTDSIVNFHPLFVKMASLLQQDYHHEIDAVNRLKLSKEAKDYKLTSLAVQYNENHKNLITIFSNNTNYATVPVVEDPPDHLLCPITFQLMHDPVVSPSGFTYEKSVLADALQRNPTDPLTRKKITIDECHPNTNLKQAIDLHLTQTSHKST
jgi:STIP1 family protein 1